MTIGTGKLAADQTRAAGQSRGRRAGVRLASGSSYLPAVPGTSTCVGCGDVLPRREMMYADDGSVCPTCFAEAQDAAMQAALPGLGRRLIESLPLVGPLWGWVGLLVWFCVANLGLAPFEASWQELVSFAAVAGSPMLLVALLAVGRLRDVVRGLREVEGDEERLRAAVVGAWLVLPMGATWVLAVWPTLLWLVVGVGR